MKDRQLLYKGNYYKPTAQELKKYAESSSVQGAIAVSLVVGILLCALVSRLEDRFGPPPKEATPNYTSINRDRQIPAPPPILERDKTPNPENPRPPLPGETLLNLYNGQFSPVILGWNSEKPEDQAHIGTIPQEARNPLYFEAYKNEAGEVVTPALKLRNPIILSPSVKYDIEFQVKTQKGPANLTPKISLLFYNASSELVEARSLKFTVEKPDSWVSRSTTIDPNSESKLPNDAIMLTIVLGTNLENKDDSAGSRIYYNEVNLRGTPKR